jgi:hypothetical protein
MLSFDEVERRITQEQELGYGFQFVNVNARGGRFDELLLRFQKCASDGMSSQNELDEILGDEIRVLLTPDFAIGDGCASDICGSITGEIRSRDAPLASAGRILLGAIAALRSDECSFQ